MKAASNTNHETNQFSDRLHKHLDLMLSPSQKTKDRLISKHLKGNSQLNSPKSKSKKGQHDQTFTNSTEEVFQQLSAKAQNFIMSNVQNAELKMQLDPINYKTMISPSNTKPITLLEPLSIENSAIGSPQAQTVEFTGSFKMQHDPKRKEKLQQALKILSEEQRIKTITSQSDQKEDSMLIIGGEGQINFDTSQESPRAFNQQPS